MNPLVLLVASLTAWLLAGCASSPEDNVSRLSGDADEREAARQELLLAKERAVAPLLVALEDPARIGARQSVVEVLAGLMTRVEAPEISAALIRHLHADDDKVVRARIAHHLGLHRHTAAADALLGALHDTDGEVRYQVLLALARMEARLDSSQIGQLRHTARELLQDDDVRVRGEALIALSAEVSEWLDQAQKAALEGRLTEAESFYLAAVDVSPSSKRAHHRLGRFYYDNGQRDRGLDLLRAEGMLLDIRRLHEAPRIDGQLTEDTWRNTAIAEGFYSFSSQHDAALESQIQTRVHIGYTDEALYLGYYCKDEHPDSLIVNTTNATWGGVWWDDDVELYFDVNFDHQTYCQIGMNSVGTVNSLCFDGGLSNRTNWVAPGTAAAHVGEDFWSVEYRLPLGSADLPRPRSGDIWGFNLVRVFRGSEYAQWTRTYGSNAHQPDEFGVLLFR